MATLKEASDYVKIGKKDQAMKIVQEIMGYDEGKARVYVDDLEKVLKPIVPKRKISEDSISAIDGMDGHDFEFFCADLLQKVGFSEVSVTPGSGDQGVDVLASKDGIKYAIQCKNYVNPLSNTPVQEVSAGKQFYGCHVGVVMTNSTFTHGAKQLANATNVLLWDREKMEELISLAGGLKRFGLYTESNDLNYESGYISIGDNGAVDCSENIDANTHKKGKRKGMSVLSWICLVWSSICSFIFVGGLIAQDIELICMGIGEGLFVFVLGGMFGVLSKSAKEDLSVNLFGWRIKKVGFVFMCIGIAFTLFMLFALVME